VNTLLIKQVNYVEVSNGLIFFFPSQVPADYYCELDNITW